MPDLIVYSHVIQKITFYLQETRARPVYGPLCLYYEY
jgi:hypothetical protein